jgi:hypothetical protein
MKRWMVRIRTAAPGAVRLGGTTTISGTTMTEPRGGNRPDYERTYDSFWRSIVEHPDGTLNRERVMRELHDYHRVMREVSAVYSHITDGALSKPAYTARDVIAEADECRDRWAKIHTADDLQVLLKTGGTREQIAARIAELRSQTER